MVRSLLRYALALVLTAGVGLAIADELADPAPAAPEMLPTAETAAPVASEACPDGLCPDIGGHGAHGGHGHHGRGPYGPYGFYPNGITNYAWKVPAYMYAGAGGCRTCSGGQCQYRFYGQPDLFYNYYAWPSCTGWGAQLYISPLPVPPNVGHTYITYQPLYPHEFMYAHHRTYHRYYNGGQGLTRASVKYVAPIFRH